MKSGSSQSQPLNHKLPLLSEEKMFIKKVDNEHHYKQKHQTVAAKAALEKKQFDSSKVLLTAAQIREKINKIAEAIAKKLKNKALLVLTLDPEGVHFSNSLTEELDRKGVILEENYLDFSTKNYNLRVEPLTTLQGRTILITGTLLSDGRKLKAALDYCIKKRAHRVYSAFLVDMPAARANGCYLTPSFYGSSHQVQTLLGFGCGGFHGHETEIRSLPLQIVRSTQEMMSLMHWHSSKPVANFRNELAAPNQTALQNAREAEKTVSSLEKLYTGAEIDKAMLPLASDLKELLKDKYPVVISMAKGGSHFTTHLTELLPGVALEECYMHITRYGKSQTGGEATLLAEPSLDLKGRTVVISEDLIEGGLTMQYAISLCLERGAKEVYVAVLGDKPSKRLPGLQFIQPDFCCYRFDQNDSKRFLVGCGLDEKEFKRNAWDLYAHPPREEKEMSEVKAAKKENTETAAQPRKFNLIKCAALGALALYSVFAGKRFLEEKEARALERPLNNNAGLTDVDTYYMNTFRNLGS